MSVPLLGRAIRHRHSAVDEERGSRVVARHICTIFCYKLHICRAAVVPSSRVVSSMKCVLQVRNYSEHIALYRTIFYCHVTGNIMGCSLRVTNAGVAG